MSIQIVDFRRYEKNTLRGFLTIQLEPSGLQIADICLHQKNGKRWLSMPAKPYEKDGETNWIPIVRFSDRENNDSFQEAALKAFDDYTNQEPDQDDIPF